MLAQEKTATVAANGTGPQPAPTPQTPPAQINFNLGRNTLARRLSLVLVPAMLVPLLAVSAIEYVSLSNKEKQKALAGLQNRAILATTLSADFLEAFAQEATIVTTTPEILATLREGARQAATQKLPERPPESVEQQFAATKLLQPRPELNAYLAQVTKTRGLAEIFFTERNGFNIAYSSPTSDFIQSDEDWWQAAKAEEQAIDDPELDESTQTVAIALAKPIKDPRNQEFLGVVKFGIPASTLFNLLKRDLGNTLQGDDQIQVVDLGAKNTILTLDAAGALEGQQPITGEDTVLERASVLAQNAQPSSGDWLELQEISGLTAGTFRHEDRFFTVTPLPGTDWAVVASTSTAQVNAAARELSQLFGFVDIIVVVLAVAIALYLAKQVSQPLANLSQTAEQMATGNLEVQATPEGTLETQTLAENFNNLVVRVKTLLEEQQQEAQRQREQREALEAEVVQILEEVGDAAVGDLTVRATLTTGDMGTVADLFNAVVENLREIAVEVKQSAGTVNSSLEQNEGAIRDLADKALAEVAAIRQTLGSVEQMTGSIQTVATTARQAAEIANDAYQTVQTSSTEMERAVDSIVNLRNTVGETAKKMKRLGESSQKISQVVSLIDEIALKTTLLAINASVEARRAGEQGQGFTVVAEQVGALAEQSATATKEIAQIVASIQAETQEVAAAMELGTAQVVDSTQSVEVTKEQLAQVLQKSQEINQLMQSISQATVSQSQTSQEVTNLMQEFTQAAEFRSQFSREVAKGIQETAQVAQHMEAAVAQFKVDTAS